MSQLLRFPSVRECTGLSRSTVFRLEKKGEFPARRKISNKTVGWVSEEIENWIQSREQITED